MPRTQLTARQKIVVLMRSIHDICDLKPTCSLLSVESESVVYNNGHNFIYRIKKGDASPV